MLRRLFPPALSLAAALALAPAQAADLTVFAAASLKTALDRIAQDWQAETGDRLIISYAGSSALARQIEAGAPADVFLSANTAWMDHLSARGLVIEDSRSTPISNQLVLIAPGRDAAPLGDWAGLPERLGTEGRLAMALVDAVPVGIYGKAALESLGLWPLLASRVAQTDNARAALALVAAGEAPLGLVYATDAGATDAVSVVAEVPAQAHPPIRYAFAAVIGGDTEGAALLLAFLQAPAARRSWEAEGFVWAAEPAQ